MAIATVEQWDTYIQVAAVTVFIIVVDPLLTLNMMDRVTQRLRLGAKRGFRSTTTFWL